MALTIRPFREDDAPVLRDVFFSSVHTLANRDYAPAQLAAWAPQTYDPSAWAARMRVNQPFVAEIDGQVAGFADLQDSGYIDLFFVAGAFARQGVGAALMTRLHQSARERRLADLWANVSLRAEPFFTRHGFAVEARQVVERLGVQLRNARMRKRMAGG